MTHPVRLGRRNRWAWLDDLGRQAWAGIGVALLCVSVAWALGRIGWYLYPIVFGAVFGVLASPVVGWLERRGVSRAAGTPIVFVVLVAAVVGLIWMIVPPFVAQASRFVGDLPEVLNRVAADAAAFERRIAATNPEAARVVASFGDGLRERAIDMADGLSGTLLGIVGTAMTLSAAGIVGAVLAFLTVKDLPRYTLLTSEWMRRPANRRLAGALRQMKTTGTSFVRGQVMLSTLGATLNGFAYALLGVPFFLPLAGLAWIGKFIPTVGPILAGVPAVLLAYAEGGLPLALGTFVAIMAIEELESFVLVPIIVGKAVELPGITVILTLTVAGATLGAAGLIVAVPTVALVRDGLRWFFLTEAEVEMEYHALTA